MPDITPRVRRLRFGLFEVDLRAGELRKQGLKIRLQAQPFQILALLLEKPRELVSREELRDRLWTADTFVDFDHGLNKTINKIREALGDSAENPRFIETVARRGYRFIADVSVIDEGQVGQAEAAIAVSTELTAPDKKGSWPFVGKLSALALALLLIALGAWRLRLRNNPATAIRSLAVLPLRNLSADASQDYFADGMTDELITDLAQLRALRVISSTSAMLYKDTHKPLRQIAQELNVDAVVEGSVLRSGDRVRVTAQLIQASDDKHLWAQSYEGDLRNTLALQNQVARAIAAEIQVNLSGSEQVALKHARDVDPEAYEAYLKGRYFWNKRTTDGLKKARDFFDQAIAKDSNYAQAYSGLADTYALLGDWQYAVMPSREALPKAKAAATKALELDETLGEAHASLAFCLDGFDWDWKSAEKEFKRAIELNPGYATAYHWYAWHLNLMGKNDEAIAEMKKAENLDPLSLIINSDLAELLVIAHFYDDAIQQSRKTIEMDPNFALAHNQLGQAYLQKKMYEQAIAEFQTAVQLSGGSSVFLANLARAYASAGKTKDATRLLDELKKRSAPGSSNASEIAAIYAALGDKDEAMKWIEKGYEERFNPGVLTRPGFDPLRSDPRFQDELRRIGLPQ
jgi:TolB-like protein/DNA-binding winged helix-turn-helix (wHTH) protein/Flp pilus assembly protein TadD